MATLVLGAAGAAIGGSIGGAILGVSAATIGGFIGSTIGSVVDSWIVSSLAPTQRIEGARLDTCASRRRPRVRSSRGSMAACAWAATSSGRRISARRPRPPRRAAARAAGWRQGQDHRVSVLCLLRRGALRGPDHRHRPHLGRRQAARHRRDHLALVSGRRGQTADPFIAARMGAANTPGLSRHGLCGLRGTAARQLRQPPAAALLRGVPPARRSRHGRGADAGRHHDPGLGRVHLRDAGHPQGQRRGADGAGEPERAGGHRRHGGGAGPPAGHGAAVESVSLVVAWFGERPARGPAIRPGVEVSAKSTSPQTLVGERREPRQRHLVSRDDQDRPVYGGTPSDFAVVQAIKEMKARGLRVTFYPFILMDVPPGNTLPNPYSATTPPRRGSPSFRGAGGSPVRRRRASPGPWTRPPRPQARSRRSSAAPARELRRLGRDRLLDRGAGDWGLRRMVLHYAHLCAAAGGVDAFLIGTEMPGLTTIRSGASTYPAVQAYRDLLADVRLHPRVRHQDRLCRRLVGVFRAPAGDGSGDVFFHLDPLWADPEIDFVGIDNYMPLSDWRDGFEHARCAGGLARDLRPGLPAGEHCGRRRLRLVLCQRGRSVGAGPHADHGRRGGQAVGLPLQGSARLVVEPALRPSGRGGERTPTAWAPQSKPIWFTELGCPAIDRGTNQPNVFFDPKSSESFVPLLLPRLAGRRDPAGLSRGDLSLVGRGREQPALVGLRRPDGACPRMRRLDLGRAALSVLPGADRRLDGRRRTGGSGTG
jgi:hypothetical protein